MPLVTVRSGKMTVVMLGAGQQIDNLRMGGGKMPIGSSGGCQGDCCHFAYSEEMVVTAGPAK